MERDKTRIGECCARFSAGLIILVCVLSAALPVFVSGQMYFSAHIIADNTTTFLDSLEVVELNDYVMGLLVEGDYQGVDDVEIRLLDSSGNVLQSGAVHSGDNLFGFKTGVTVVKLFRGGQEVLSSGIGFCNQNRICEPCEGPDCTLLENVLTCSDCSSGEQDFFCDTIQDSICDPDCGFDASDPDCTGIDEALSCFDYGGDYCSPGEDCIGGSTLFAADSMYCCIGGVCAGSSEYVESMAELESQPSMSITPSGELASAVLDEGIDDYCSGSLRGQECAAFEDCSGTQVEFYYGRYCCLAGCVFEPEVQTVLEEDYFADQAELPAQEIMTLEEELFEFEPDDLIDVEVFDGADDVAERDMRQYELEEEIIGEEVPGKIRERIAEVIPSVPGELAGFSYVTLLVSLLVLLLLVTVIVALFRRSADRKISQEAKAVAVPKAQLPGQQVQQPGQADLQALIDSYVAKGYSYAQVRSALVAAGYQQDLVVAEIRKNYDIRLRRQAGRR